MSNGTVDDTDLAVGLLFSHETLADGGVFVKESCSGELVAPSVILTAGHCFDTNIMDSFYVGQGVAVQSGDTDWEKATVHMTKYVIDQWTRPPAYKSGTGCPPTVLDVAVAHLAQPVTNVTPLDLATAPPPAGATVQTIGFGRHPTSSAPDPNCLAMCNGDCTCQAHTCGCMNLQMIFGNACICTDQGSYDQLVRRTAMVPIADVQSTTLHQTDISSSVDLPGESGGAVIYGGAIVGTDSCGNGPANAQTDQFFARIDLAHDWIVGQINAYEGDSGAGDDGGASSGSSGGTSGSTSGSGSTSSSGGSSSGSGSSTSGSTSGSSSGSSSSSGSTSSTGSTSSGTSTGSTGSTSGGGTSGSSSGSTSGTSSGGSGSSSGAASSGSSGSSSRDGLASDDGSSAGCGCVAAGRAADGPTRGGWWSLVALGVAVSSTLARRSRKL